MNDKKLTPIWDELSAIGEAAPTGTWDAVPTDLSTNIGQSTSKNVLLAQLMDSNLAKNEREWFAASEIERLTVENEALKLAHARYECVRCLSPRSFAELCEHMVRTPEDLDAVIDAHLRNKR